MLSNDFFGFSIYPYFMGKKCLHNPLYYSSIEFHPDCSTMTHALHASLQHCDYLIFGLSLLLWSIEFQF